MIRQWLRPVALLTLVAFLATNGRVGNFVIARHVNARPVQSEPTPSDRHEACCCCCKTRAECSPGTESAPPAVQTPPSSAERNCPVPGCPCCPGCPGGCIYCSVAKAPCLAGLHPVAMELAPCMGRCLIEVPFHAPAPPVGEIFQPPRV